MNLFSFLTVCNFSLKLSVCDINYPVAFIAAYTSTTQCVHRIIRGYYSICQNLRNSLQQELIANIRQCKTQLKCPAALLWSLGTEQLLAGSFISGKQHSRNLLPQAELNLRDEQFRAAWPRVFRVNFKTGKKKRKGIRKEGRLVSHPLSTISI